MVKLATIVYICNAPEQRNVPFIETACNSELLRLHPLSKLGQNVVVVDLAVKNE